MATLKQRLHRKNSSGLYDTIHLETSADLVLMPDGTQLSAKLSLMDTAIAGKAASNHTHAAQTSVTGNAGTATKLATSRTIRTNLSSTSTASFDGSANITPGVTGVLPVAHGGTGCSSLTELKKVLGFNNAVIEGIPTTLGTTVVWAGYPWLVCHVDSNYVYMILNMMTELTYFGSTVTYASSTVANKCTQFLATISSANQAKLATVTINGVASKVFIPSYEQVTSEFDWFNNNKENNRIGMYNTNAIAAWWLSSPGDSTKSMVVAGSGIIVYEKPSESMRGFRPCIAFKLW